MRKFVLDPAHNPVPTLRVENIKEYKETVETLHKLVAGTTGANKKSSPMLDSLTPPPKKQIAESAPVDEYDAATIIAEKVL